MNMRALLAALLLGGAVIGSRVLAGPTAAPTAQSASSEKPHCADAPQQHARPRPALTPRLGEGLPIVAAAAAKTTHSQSCSD